jgi:cytochrome b pre-mRNA-processing protein 3
MLGRWLGGGRRLRRTGDRLYVGVVEQARAPWLYSDLGVPDTVDGRFDLIALHVWAVLRRLRDAPAPAPQLAQRLVDVMFTDMDRGLREMGVGDHGVSKRLKQMLRAFHGRVAAYDQAMLAGPEALAAALARNLLRAETPTPAAVALAGYVQALTAALAAWPVPALLDARLPPAPSPG